MKMDSEENHTISVAHAAFVYEINRDRFIGLRLWLVRLDDWCTSAIKLICLILISSLDPNGQIIPATEIKSSETPLVIGCFIFPLSEGD